MKFLLVPLLVTTAAGAEELKITVYDQAEVPVATLAEAGRALHQIFSGSGISVRLITGDPSAPESSLFLYSNFPGKQAACSARREIALQIVDTGAPGLNRSILGVAQPLAAAGLNVRIYDDRVQNAAVGRNQSHGVVLAHVIAHEIGHVLLRDGGHGSRGLMSARWGDHEYRWMKFGALSFTEGESRRMRESLNGTGCPASEATTELITLNQR